MLSTVTLEDANAQRLKLAEEVAEAASFDLQKLGLVLDFVKIQTISDDQDYLKAIGRKKNAEVVKNATGLDVPGLLNTAANHKKTKERKTKI